jgi:hypothetical protein
MPEPYEPKGGWSPNLTAKDKRKIQKRYAKQTTKNTLKHVLPVAAGTAGVATGAAKSAEKTLSEDAIFRTRQVAQGASDNLTNVLNSTQLGPFQRLRANRIIKKNVRAGMEEGKNFGESVFKGPNSV